MNQGVQVRLKIGGHAANAGCELMRRSFALLVAIIVVSACGCGLIASAQSQAGANHKIASEEQKPSSKPAIEFLLDSAAAEFHSHQPHPARFRHVRFAYLIGSDGRKQYMLCGEFLAAEKTSDPRWAPFATIRTSGYEQYLGGQAASFCKSSKPVWNKDDLSYSLQSRFDSLRKDQGFQSHWY